MVSHVNGTIMISQGTDGVSRGSLKEGFLLGESMLNFCPWHLNALEREPALEAWIKSWVPLDTIFLEPKDWFTCDHEIVGGVVDVRGFWRPNIESGTYVWTPPP